MMQITAESSSIAPWLYEEKLGGMSDAAKESSWRASQERQEEEARFERERRAGANRINVGPWWRDASTIPSRHFLDADRHYCRGTVGATIAAGGRAKTTRSIYEAVSFSVGRDLSSCAASTEGPLRVLVLNGEEDQAELDRRVAATCQHYGVCRDDLGGRLFVLSVRDTPLRIAKPKTGGAAEIDAAVVEMITAMINDNNIDVVMIDPLVSFHSVAENDNGMIDLMIKQGFGAIAKRTAAHCEVYHHPGKPKQGQTDTSVEDGRGASALLWAVRSARVFNFMKEQEAKRLGIAEDQRRTYIRISNGKANMGPLGKAKWMRLIVETLPNGDEVAVASSWSPPNPFDGVTTHDMRLAVQLAATGGYRADSRSPSWFGYAIANHLHIAVAHGGDNDQQNIERIKSLIKTWVKTDVLRIETRKDTDHKERQFIVPGSVNCSADITTDDDDI